jgi:S-DNA-T family DNA segregation ATPase FtsK/SpoIIIE
MMHVSHRVSRSVSLFITMPKQKEIKPKGDIKGKMAPRFTPGTVRIAVSIILILVLIILILSIAGQGGSVGTVFYTKGVHALLGIASLLLPLGIIAFLYYFTRGARPEADWIEWVSGSIFIVAMIGLSDRVSGSAHATGIFGAWLGSTFVHGFGRAGSIILFGGIALVSLIILLNKELDFSAAKDFVASKMAPKNTEDSTEWVDEEPTPAVIKKESEPEKPAEEKNEEPKKKKMEVEKDEEEELPIIQQKKSADSTYIRPPLSILATTSGKPGTGDIKAQQNLIKRTLQNFGIEVEMDDVSIGPTVTRFALKPAEGVKLSRIVALQNDLALALAAHPIRIEAPIPGKSLVGIEVPNKSKSMVGLGTLLADDQFENTSKKLLVALGKGVTGKSYFDDIAGMPHLLIAGTTGSGKSVTVHNLIMSLIYKHGPEDVRFIFVDPKRVELTQYNNIPHLLTPVIKEPKKAILALKWAAKEMERRYDILENHTCRDIGSYRAQVWEPYAALKKKDDVSAPEKMPYIVIIIDELADIMQAYPRELEAAIVRLAQMSRATGIHLMLSTQRPSVNVITGLIKANIPSRLALQVASQIDSRTILDGPGAETLLGHGDMLYLGAKMSKPERMQAANVTEEEIKKTVQFIKKNNDLAADEISIGEQLDADKSIVTASFDDDEEDELYEEARRVVEEAGKASTSYIQRKLKVGYSRAARLIDILEERGVVGPADGSKPREVIGRGGAASPSAPVDNPDNLDTDDIME